MPVSAGDSFPVNQRAEEACSGGEEKEEALLAQEKAMP